MAFQESLVYNETPTARTTSEDRFLAQLCLSVTPTHQINRVAETAMLELEYSLG
jgi:hypothetical protein